MARTKRKPIRATSGRNRNQSDQLETDQYEQQFYTPPQRLANEPLKARNPKQSKYIKAVKNKTIVFGIGPAGTGKTFIATVVACDMLINGEIEQIIITRPAVEAGEKLGFLPGDENEKYAPYIAPFREIMNKRLGKSRVDYMLKKGIIRPEPLAYMRGKTFDNALVILDEAQNTTKDQLKLLLTRIGENCRVIVDGDIDQTDIHNSGLQDAIDRLSFIPSVDVIEFNSDEVVRSGICGEVVKAYASPVIKREY